ncbi:MAG: hypothetical protein HPY60_11575 [Candidatus Methanofastidiosum sp.]|nr:hypothetical protein [Methanofastidiosum sp.]
MSLHPFGSKVGKRWYFLIHNGVLGERMREIAENFGANKLTDVKVDSELFLRCITAQIRQGEKLVDAIKSATYEVSNVGDYAFALLTSEGIYLWRNEYRPLSVFYHKNNIFFASTMEMWKNALEIAGVEQEKIVYTEIEPHQLYILKINKGKPAVFRICEIPHKTHKRELERLNYSYYTSILSENGKNGNKKAKKKNKEKEDPRYNPFLFGEFANDDEEETHIFSGDKSPREMTTREIEREIEILEEYYYDGNLSISEQVEVERRLQELYYELNVRNTFVDDEEEAENVEPF